MDWPFKVFFIPTFLSSTLYMLKNIRKKIAEVNKYILIGLRYAARLPATYSLDKNPGLKMRNFKELKNFPSK